MRDSLADKPHNRVAARGLISAIKETGIVLFIGAGLSVPFGFPAWKQFLRKSGKHAGVPIEGYLEAGRFEEAAEALITAKGRPWLDHEVSRVFGRKPSPPRTASALPLLPRLANGPIVTTNFDRVLEHVFDSAKKRF
jgi:hypothetical protein